MAKQFKINIKNAQIAEAINLSGIKKKLGTQKGLQEKKKKPTSKAEKEKSTASEVVREEVEPVESQAEAPKIKARSRSAFAEKDAQKPAETVKEEIEEEEEPSIIEEPAVEEAIEEAPPAVAEEVEPPEEVKPPTPKGIKKPNLLKAKASTEGLAKLQAQAKEKLGPTGRHVRDFVPKKEESKEQPKKEKKPQTTEFKSDDAKKKGKGPKKEYRDLKPAKKSPGQPTSFDSRDRQGLRGREDEGQWKRRRSHKMGKRRAEEIQIVRPTSLTLRLPIVLKDLAQEMKLKTSELISKLFLQGVVVTLNDLLDDETTIQLLGQEFGCQITIDTSEEERIRITDKTVSEEIKETKTDDLTSRPPIIAFMGHVDHGKTSLIDKIRKSNVVSQEAGAITQHIGAFTCSTSVGDITILDTPGHEAFTEMRARGADVTDIVVLVVAGDEGMKQQTQEAIQHAKAAGVTIVVAINKCDKPNFNAETVYRQLADLELLPESWGGTTITVNTSAETGEGIEPLLEMLALQSEILELRANPQSRARGRVLESEMHKGMGAVTTVLIQNGTLHKGDSLVFETHFAKVKTMRDEYGTNLDDAGPSLAVEITGLSGLPSAGDEFIVVKSEKEAREIAETRALDHKQLSQATPKRSLENIFQQVQDSDKKVLKLILRADVQGSLEALKAALLKIQSDKVELDIIFSGVGEISESDVQLAAASKAFVIGFHNSIEQHAEQLVKEQGVTVHLHEVIYHAIDDVKDLMTGKLDKLAQEEDRGKATVLQTFKSSQVGIIAGCIVNDGTIHRNHHIRIRRGTEIIHTGSITSLKRVKEDVREVSKGLECGIVLSSFNEIEPDDVIEAYDIIYISQKL